MIYVTRDILEKMFERLDTAGDLSAPLYLIGETSLVWEGARSFTDEVEIAVGSGAPEGDGLAAIIRQISADLDVQVVCEFPGDVIPLPDGWQKRCRLIDYQAGALEIAHFDPYSVSFRFLARGDEEDYKLVIAYLELGWISSDKMDRRLSELLPRFSFETIAQDPAEFRRKYKGLQQMAKARGLI